MTLQQIQQMQQAVKTIESVSGHSAEYILRLLGRDPSVVTDKEQERILRSGSGGFL